MAAQFLQQMYAAQQQHLMLQTAALQQQHQHSPHLQSLATMHQVRSPGCLSYESFWHELQGGWRLSHASQASVRQRQSTSSSSEGLTHQPAGVSVSICVILVGVTNSQHKNEYRHLLHGIQIALPASPVTAQLVGRTQNSISSGVSTTISQQAMLLGGRPANCNQAQMYLRTQMV